MRMDINRSFGTGTMTIPMGTPTLAANSLQLVAYRLTVYDWADTGTLKITGNSLIRYGSELDTQGQGTGGIGAGPLENDGIMTLRASTLKIGVLKGHGSINAYASTIDVLSAPTSETIQLRSSYLDIGTAGQPDPGMQFLAPIHVDGFSNISLEDTHATLEVYFRSSGALFLFDGSQMVANMHITGSPNLYAEQVTPAYGFPSVTISSTNLGHALPMVAFA